MDNQLEYTTAEEFLNSGSLKRVDVMLSKNKKAFFSKLIMWATKSNWSHAALVFVISSPKTGFDNTFVIESTGDGVDITNLRYYLEEHSKEYDIGFKRLDVEWFSNDKLGLEIRKRIRGSMLNLIKAKYDMGKILHIAKMILERLLFGVRVRISSLEKVMRKAREKGNRVPSQFICSGLVQYGFYSTISELIGEGVLSEDKLKDVIFNPRIDGDIDRDILLSTTPQDLANSEKLKWKYVIHDGKTYEISTSAEVEKIIK